MTLPLYLALTGEEFSRQPLLDNQLAWMACEFSQTDTGLSNLPPALPPGSMVILSDAMPLQGHREDMILSQLQALQADSVLLDFQRPYDEKLQRLAELITTGLSCPVGVSHIYAKDIPCPVFLPPVPLNKTPKAYLAPWEGRELWLDVALDALQIVVTPKGSRFLPLVCPPEGEFVFQDTDLHCSYYTTVAESEVRFTLYRTKEMLGAFLAAAKKCGVTRCIGFYQELYENSL